MTKSSALISPALSAIVFALALEGGAFSVSSWTTLALGVWWFVLAGIFLGLWPSGRIAPGAAAAGAFLASFAAWTGASMTWADDREAAFLELNRTLLYLGTFVLVVLASRRATLRRWSDGLALGIVAVAVVALLSRFFPDVVDPGALADAIPEAGARLSYPLGYWNGVAILAALALPLLYTAALRASTFVIQAAAIAAVPAIGAVIYLASSRGGALVAAVGSLTFLALVRRWAAAGAIAVGAAGAAVAVVWGLEPRTALMESPLSALGRVEGRSAAVLLVGVCVVSGTAYAALPRMPFGRPFSPPAGRRLALLAGAVGVLGLASSHPIARFDAFKRPPTPAPMSVRGHFLSGAGSGRWQEWSAAMSEFRAYPLRGGGAGSYAPWRLRHAGAGEPFTTEAHSLFLETLGELGLVGFALLALALSTAMRAAGRAFDDLDDELRLERAAPLAVACAYLVGAAVDWMWELPIVSVIGAASLALSLVPEAGRAHPRILPRAARLIMVVVAVSALCAESIALLGNERLRASQRAAEHGDLAAAADAALEARQLEPWAAAPSVQLALLNEQVGSVPTARRWIGDALRRDPSDWRTWVVATRLRIESGDVGAARRALATARRLNPNLDPADRG
jgi:hypothetical protein